MFRNLLKLLMVGLILTAVGCNISGTVKDVDGNPMEGVTITLTGADEMVTTTNAKGRYTFAYLDAGEYTVTPSLEDTMFEPASKTVNLSWSNLSAHFIQYVPPTPPEPPVVPDPPTYDISGNFLAEVTSPVALSVGGGVVYMNAYIEQTDDNTFTMELTDYENCIITGTIKETVYTATQFPSESIDMDFGAVVVQVKFKSAELTALSNDRFTGKFSISATYSTLTLSDGDVTAEGNRKP